MNYDKEPDEVIEPYKCYEYKHRSPEIPDYILAAFLLLVFIGVAVPLVDYWWHFWMGN